MYQNQALTLAAIYVAVTEQGVETQAANSQGTLSSQSSGTSRKVFN